MADYWNDVVRLAYFSQRSRQHIRIGYVIVGCDARECRVLLPKGIRIGERATCPSLGSLDGVAPDNKACHVSSGGGVPTLWPVSLILSLYFMFNI